LRRLSFTQASHQALSWELPHTSLTHHNKPISEHDKEMLTYTFFFCFFYFHLFCFS
jgi:hypothetical protein